MPDFAAGVRLEVRITPDDLGKRVSVRSLVDPAGPGGGFTDTVGVLTSWTDGVITVTRRDGTFVELAEEAVVAGKVVPPAPARRRGVPAAGLGELCAVAARGWPAPEEERIGDWLCRAAGGWTRRANSAVPLGPGAPDVKRITAWYARRGLPPQLAVTTGAAGAHELTAATLTAAGWTASGHAVTLVGSLAALADREPDPRVVIGREPDARWLRGYPNAHRDPGTARRVLAAGPGVRFATVPDPEAGPDAPPRAVGRCTVDGRWAGFAAVEVAPAQRRRGLAGAVIAELARRALAGGASAAWLQVEVDNAPARALYAGAGFAEHHHYHYLRMP
ncbi:GNAT family N-acetyltransferase [Streptomyces alkaliphilus]|uniref:GNAT family N-acetyltransferase n=1 Tax=Streptomyces alkaliphilus TaxID=1472722 RepID=UPI00117CE711|nr:GNAT family N-acetyltransferase [Streptomyces alkaliphilus]MQS08934.1 GNAT family N-acetyltransferase [Streptomyces alkaliphilus]